MVYLVPVTAASLAWVTPSEELNLQQSSIGHGGTNVIVVKQRSEITDFEVAINHNLIEAKNSVKYLGGYTWTINCCEKFT